MRHIVRENSIICFDDLVPQKIICNGFFIFVLAVHFEEQADIRKAAEGLSEFHFHDGFAIWDTKLRQHFPCTPITPGSRGMITHGKPMSGMGAGNDENIAAALLSGDGQDLRDLAEKAEYHGVVLLLR